jgi:hypothetical protein
MPDCLAKQCAGGGLKRKRLFENSPGQGTRAYKGQEY